MHCHSSEEVYAGLIKSVVKLLDQEQSIRNAVEITLTSIASKCDANNIWDQVLYIMEEFDAISETKKMNLHDVIHLHSYKKFAYDIHVFEYVDHLDEEEPLDFDVAIPIPLDSTGLDEVAKHNIELATAVMPEKDVVRVILNSQLKTVGLVTSDGFQAI